MIKTIIIYCLALIIFILQTTFPYNLSIGGITPNWLIFYMISWWIILKDKKPWFLFFLTGLFMSLYSHWSWKWWLIIALLVLTTHLLSKYFREFVLKNLIIASLIVFFYEIIIGAGLIIIDHWHWEELGKYIWKISWLETLLNLLVAIGFVYVNQGWFYYRKSDIKFENK